MRKKVLAVIYLLALSVCVHAQSWQWGKRGGSWSGPVTAGYDEELVDMTTDAHGNVYTLSQVWSPGLDIDGHTKTGYGAGDIIVSSFACDGTYRWSKIMGGHQDSTPASIKTDTLGGVYISGYLVVNSSSLFIDADTAWAGGLGKTLFVAKFDSNGAYKWFHMPQPDTATGISSGQCAVYDIDVDVNGNIYAFFCLAPGAYENGAYVVTTQSQHVLQYTSSGTFVGGTQLDMSYSGGSSPFFRMKRDHNNGRYYIAGSRPYLTTIHFGSTTIPNTLYLACYNSAGTCLWVKQNTNNLSNAPTSRPDVDASGNVYVTASGVHNDTFASYVVNNPLGPGSVPEVLKLDSNGNLLWGVNGQSRWVVRPWAIAVNGNETAITGIYGGFLKWDNDTLERTVFLGTEQPFIVRLNTSTGTYIGMDSLYNGGGNARPWVITADKAGSFYIGGFFTSVLKVGGSTLNWVGGLSDFFIAKYGSTNCGCTIPTAAFTSVGTSTVAFTYTGTTGYDSVRWNFGDGGTSTLASPTHTYGAAGTYTVCVTAYTSCGSDVSCHTVTVPAVVGIAGTAFEQVRIYPTPVTDALNIEGAAGETTVAILSMMGKEVYRNKCTGMSMQIDMRSLPPGSYIIQLTGKNGERMNARILKP